MEQKTQDLWDAFASVGFDFALAHECGAALVLLRGPGDVDEFLAEVEELLQRCPDRENLIRCVLQRLSAAIDTRWGADRLRLAFWCGTVEALLIPSGLLRSPEETVERAEEMMAGLEGVDSSVLPWIDEVLDEIQRRYGPQRKQHSALWGVQARSDAGALWELVQQCGGRLTKDSEAEEEVR